MNLGYESTPQPPVPATEVGQAESPMTADGVGTGPTEQETITATNPVQPLPAPRAAIIVQCTNPALLEALATPLTGLADKVTLFVLAPETQRQVMLAKASALGLDADVRATEAQAASALLQLLAEIDPVLHPCFCRIIETTSSPATPTPFGADLFGSAVLAEQLLTLFMQDTSVVLAGPAIDYVSVLSDTPPGLTKLQLAKTALFPDGGAPDDWGYFSTGSFWGRTEAFRTLLSMPQAIALFDAKKQAYLGQNEWNQAFERLFGVLALHADGTVALVDHVVESDGSQPLVRVAPSGFGPSLRPLSARLHAYALLHSRLLHRYLLLEASGLLDSLWYYARHPELTSNWRDCLEHHLQHPHFPLSAAHENGELEYAFIPEGLDIRYANSKGNALIKPAHSLLSGVVSSTVVACDPPRIGGIKVSVICATYNHERFLRQCLDSLVGQQTDFDYEILVGDDGSTDATPDIVREYAERHPGRVIATCRPANIGPIANTNDLLRRARGQYLAICEGDDYWTDPHKLQMQTLYLDANPQCALHFHPVSIVEETSPDTIEVHPRIAPGQKLCTDHIIQNNFIQTNSVMYRRNDSLLTLFQANASGGAMPPDWLAHILASTSGELHASQSLMSAYRLHAGGLWSTQMGPTFLARWGMEHIEFHIQGMRITRTAHHPHWCSRLLTFFTSVFNELFLKQDSAGLFALVDRYPELADLFFTRNGIAIRSHAIVDEDALIAAFRSVFSISTIIPVYNNAPYLEQCLDSVTRQTGLFRHEVIIADDASTDGGLQIAKRLQAKAASGVRLLRNVENQGVRANYLHAIAACTGNFIAICEGDDYWLSADKLARQLLFMIHHPKSPMCFNWILLDNVGGSSSPHPDQACIKGDTIGFDDLVAKPLTANLSACFYRRQVLAELPETITGSPYFGDWLVNLHASTMGPLGFMRDILSAYRVHQGGQWSGLSEKHKETLVLECRQSLLDVLPEQAGQVIRYLPAPAGDLALPEALPLANTPGLRFHLDQGWFSDSFMALTGWVTNPTAGAYVNEEKYLFVTTASGQVVHRTRIVNVQRPDVHLYHRDQLGTGQLDFTWAGYRAFVPLHLADGNYRLAVALRLRDGLTHAFLNPVLQVNLGIPDFA